MSQGAHTETITSGAILNKPANGTWSACFTGENISSSTSSKTFKTVKLTVYYSY
ncbi:hypothetical protein [Methylomusa anaerophila]|uniref:hypothetical protein n=1 Tax=Methylomusa anaerophila TaxID=1930071 RepID=UPI001315477B|nr:hypothetical protein [Methylomusa anaerophila]